MDNTLMPDSEAPLPSPPEQLPPPVDLAQLEPARPKVASPSLEGAPTGEVMPEPRETVRAAVEVPEAERMPTEVPLAHIDVPHEDVAGEFALSQQVAGLDDVRTAEMQTIESAKDTAAQHMTVMKKMPLREIARQAGQVERWAIATRAMRQQLNLDRTGQDRTEAA